MWTFHYNLLTYLLLMMLDFFQIIFCIFSNYLHFSVTISSRNVVRVIYEYFSACSIPYSQSIMYLLLFPAVVMLVLIKYWIVL